ncbi:hypothetical protein Tco_0673751 [Tanacetum coccineum]
MNFLSESLTARIKEQVKDQLPQILPKEVSNFAPPVIKKLIIESRDEVTLAKVSSQPQSTYEAASTLTEFELKKILLDKMEKKPTTKPKNKDSTSGSSKGTKSQPKSSRKSVQSEELVFEVAASDMPHDQEGNMGDNKDEPRKETASRRDWFKKSTPPQEPTNPNWNIGKTTQEGPTQNWLMTLVASTSTDKSLKDFDELMSIPIEFSGYILNGLKIENLTQEILLGPAFRLLKGTRSNYAELEYDFEECYKALSEKLDWENPKGGDYPFDLSKPLPLITYGNRQRVPFEFFINNDLKYLQGGVSTMTCKMSTTKSNAAKVSHIGENNVTPSMHMQEAYNQEEMYILQSIFWQSLMSRLVPSCFVIFDFEPLSLSFDFVFLSEIFKSLSFSLDRLCHLAILCLDQHAHTSHLFESLLTISLDRLDILKEDLVYQSLRKSLSLILELS